MDVAFSHAFEECFVSPYGNIVSDPHSEAEVKMAKPTFGYVGNFQRDVFRELSENPGSRFIYCLGVWPLIFGRLL